MKTKKYTIEEIKYYLEGCELVHIERDEPISEAKLIPSEKYNVALDNAITELEDKYDGIEAIIQRKK
jgi:hypothetical protein